MVGKRKKTSKKKVADPVVEVAADPRDPEAEPTPAPAIVEEATITVRGTAVGGTRKMTPSEYAKYKNG